MHEPPLLDIIMCIGLADAIFSLGWLIVSIEAGLAVAGQEMFPAPIRRRRRISSEEPDGLEDICVVNTVGNVLLIMSEVAQAAWTIVLAWYLGRVLLDGRSAIDWRRWRGVVHLIAWGTSLAFCGAVVPTLGSCYVSFPPQGQGRSATIDFVGVCSSDPEIVVTNATIDPYNISISNASPDTYSIFGFVPLVTSLIILVTYVRIALHIRRAGSVNLKLVLRLSSYLLAYFVGQCAGIVYHLQTVALHGLSGWNAADIVSSSTLQVWTAWTFTAPLQGLLDLLVYSNHACRYRSVAGGRRAAAWPRSRAWTWQLTNRSSVMSGVDQADEELLQGTS